MLLLGYAYYRSTDSDAGLPPSACFPSRDRADGAGPLRRPDLAKGECARRDPRPRLRLRHLGLSFSSCRRLGGPDYSYVASAILCFVFPRRTGALRHSDPLVNATVLSLLVNTAAFVLGSLTRNARPLERIQAGIFVKRHSRSQFKTRGWKTRVSIGDLKDDDRALSRRRAHAAVLQHL